MISPVLAAAPLAAASAKAERDARQAQDRMDLDRAQTQKPLAF